jgi:hypothetical protein
MTEGPVGRLYHLWRYFRESAGIPCFGLVMCLIADYIKGVEFNQSQPTHGDETMTTRISIDSLKHANEIATTYRAIGYAVEINTNHGTGPLFIVNIDKN